MRRVGLAADQLWAVQFVIGHDERVPMDYAGTRIPAELSVGTQI
jgi:hypothetical protein